MAEVEDPGDEYGEVYANLDVADDYNSAVGFDIGDDDWV